MKTLGYPIKIAVGLFLLFCNSVASAQDTPSARCAHLFHAAGNEYIHCMDREIKAYWERTPRIPPARTDREMDRLMDEIRTPLPYGPGGTGGGPTFCQYIPAARPGWGGTLLCN